MAGVRGQKQKREKTGAQNNHWSQPRTARITYLKPQHIQPWGRLYRNTLTGALLGTRVNKVPSYYTGEETIHNGMPSENLNMHQSLHSNTVNWCCTTEKAEKSKQNTKSQAASPQSRRPVAFFESHCKNFPKTSAFTSSLSSRRLRCQALTAENGTAQRTRLRG